MQRFLFFLLLVSLSLSNDALAQKIDTYEYGIDRKKLPKLTLFNHNRIMKKLLGEPKIKINRIGILVYDGVNTMEAIAPMSVFSELMNVKISYIGIKEGKVHTTLTTIEASETINEAANLDLLVIPGGDSAALTSVLGNTQLLQWISKMDASAKITAIIGNGAIVAAKAGIIHNKKIALPWFNAGHNAQLLNVHYDEKSYTQDGKYYSCAGNMTAIDLCLKLVGDIAGVANLQGAMLDLEYDPQPPVITELPGKSYNLATTQSVFNEYQINGLQILKADKISENATLKTIGILVYPDFFTLDVIGPLVVLSQLPGTQVKLISTGDTKIKSGRTYFYVNDLYTSADQLDMLIVPGGSTGTWELTQDKFILDWIRKMDQTTTYTASVCTGSWVLGAAGLLKNKKASTNWYRAAQMMERYGATFTNQRYTTDGKYWTSAGVSAGIDMSFGLIQHLLGAESARQAMLNVSYHPRSPIRGGTPEKTDDFILDMMHQMYDYLMIPKLKK